MRFGNQPEPKSREEIRKELNQSLARLHDQRSMVLLVKVIVGLAIIPCSLLALQGHNFLNGAAYQSLGYAMFLLGLALSIFSGLVILWGLSYQINAGNAVRKVEAKIADTYRAPGAKDIS